MPLMIAGHASLAEIYSSTARNLRLSRHAIPDAELGSSRPVTAPTTTQEEFGTEVYQVPVNVVEVREHAGHIADIGFVSLLYYNSHRVEHRILIFPKGYRLSWNCRGAHH